MIRLRTLGWLILPLLILVGCKNDNTVVTSTTVLVAGDVDNLRTQRGIPNVLISTLEYPEQTTTDSSGHYRLEIATGDSFRGGIHIVASATGYTRDSVVVFGVSGRQINVPTIVLENLNDIPDTTSHGPSSAPASILYVGSNVAQIGVRETGIVESAILTYEVRDIRGIPVDLNNQTTVFFRIDGQTGGGEYLGNDSAITNENGRVQTSIIAGIRPGTVEIVATTHDTIRARPVRMTIHTGPPDSLHTTIGAQEWNFPGIGYLNRVDSITVLLGDRYSNPVPLGTESYFSTDHGVIQAQGVADSNGFDIVALYSANPYPTDPISRGWSWLHVQTVDWTGHRYTVSGPILWTGPVFTFTIDPVTFDIPNGGSQDFHAYVADIFDHPLSRFTTFKVNSTLGVLTGDIDVIMGDNQYAGNGATDFYFTLTDNDTASAAHSVAVTATVDGRNGHRSRTVSGTMH